MFKSMVNFSPKVMCDAIVGYSCRTVHSTFALPTRMPDTAVFVLGNGDRLDAKLWVTVMVELLKAMRGTNHVLRMTLWEH